MTVRKLISGALAALAAAVAIPASAAGWVATGSMAEPRAYHTVTQLPGKKGVLVAGGYQYSGSQYLATAELYDPETGNWTPAGTMSEPRAHAGGALLSTGQVLVVGGQNGGSNGVASCDLWDPHSGTWMPTGSLAARRSYATATVLDSGKVLVAGGWDGGSYLTSAELYDPATGTWSPAGSMMYGRVNHTATLLASGKVLVVGGDGLAGTPAELYDPVTGAWATTGSPVTRTRHSATILGSGQVLVAGGGEVTTGTVATAELYDPATETWTPTGSLLLARNGQGAVRLPSGQVLVAGGYSTWRSVSDSYVPDAELYDPNTGTWTATASMATGRACMPLTLLKSGAVLVAGGANYPIGSLSSAELYWP